MQPKPPRISTKPGLGEGTGVPRTSFPHPPLPEVEHHAPDAPTSSERSARRTVSWAADRIGVRSSSPSREGRAAVTVDDVGVVAVKIARGARRSSAPKLVASREAIASAPIDTRSAFVLALVDGQNMVDAIVDMAGMPEDEVRAILARLARLGLIATA